MSKWNDAIKNPPKKAGKYLVVYRCFHYRDIRVISYTLNLKSVDEYYFVDEDRPGWYRYDSERGYYEVSDDVVCWQDLPPMPEESEFNGN